MPSAVQDGMNVERVVEDCEEDAIGKALGQGTPHAIAKPEDAK